MYLEKATFPVSFDLKEAKEKVASLLKQNHWLDFSFTSYKLFYIPYIFFHYDIFEEMEKKVTHVSKGSNALNSSTKEFEKEISEMSSLHSAKESEPINDYDFKVIAPVLSEHDAEEFIKLKIASIEGTAKQNVMVSGIEMFFVPLWEIKVTALDHKFVFRVNSTLGKILNPQIAVNDQPKTTHELASEALQEFSDPKEWLNYSAELLSGLPQKFSGVFSTQNTKSSQQNSFTIVLVLAILAIIVILWVVYGH